MDPKLIKIVENDKFVDKFADLISKEIITKSNKNRIEQEFKKATSGYEIGLQKIVQKFLESQRDAIIEVMSRKFYGIHIFIKAEEDPIFNIDEWNKKLRDEVETFMKAMYVLEGARSYETIKYWVPDLEGSFDDRFVQQFLDKYTFTFANKVNTTTEEAVRKVMKLGMDRGLNMRGIANIIGGISSPDWVQEEMGNTFKEFLFDKKRSFMIARTETIRASNYAAVESYQQSGVVEGKQWLTTKDDRTCFLPDTVIKTITGYKKIQKVKIGDFVLTHQNQYKEVIKTHKNSYNGQLVKIYYGDNYVVATSNHPIWVNGEWIEAGKIKVGGSVVFACSGDFYDVKISLIEKFNVTNETVHNLTVDEDNSYVANYIVVHNCNLCLSMNGKVTMLDQNFFDKGDSLSVTSGNRKFSLKFDYEDIGAPPLHVNCRCFPDGQIPIYTSKGWKRIIDVKVGDLVLTHKGRFRKVIQLHRNKKENVELVTLGFNNPVMTKENDYLTMTANHPVLVNGKWKNAGDIECDDRIIAKGTPYSSVGMKIDSVIKFVSNNMKTLYNLSVEEDESYIAKGVVVHNCTILPWWEEIEVEVD